jgi:dipeptidyl aminopeptidase/acylaminoacyl peptidase
MMTNGASGQQVVRLSSDGQSVFLSGTTRGDEDEDDDPDDDEENTEPARPFIDRLTFRTGELTRLYEGSTSFTESISAVIDNDVTEIVIQRQSSTMVPQSIHKNLVTGAERQLTRNEDFTPEELRNVKRVTFDAKRADGLDVRVRVTLPATFQEGDRLPAMFWFYPREYTSFEAYRRTVNDEPEGPGRYPSFSPGSVQLFVLLGYAVIEPDAPIIGAEGRMNDNYVHDLRNNLSAVIDELDRRGIADRNKLAIGGHSYGGFGTMNAMVHTPYFKAGISGAGNSNRMLTPLGFQSERRLLWEARETYLDMSPLLHANQMTGALLMYHGMQDQNVGTNPINSERMFHVLNGLGKTVSLYMYPFEDHGQIAEETRLDMWARWAAWLEKHVKGTPAAAAVTEQEDGNDGTR